MRQLGKFTWIRGHVTWLEDNKEYLDIPYVREEFNDIEQNKIWKSQGHNPRTGRLFDMRYENQPSLTKKLIEFAESEELEHVGVSYYMMEAGDNLPYHSDTYNKYVSLFNLQNRNKKIVRFIFFPEDRKPGHIFEVDGKSFDWKAGDWVAWMWDTQHMAANLGIVPRYSIQVTGVLREGL